MRRLNRILKSGIVIGALLAAQWTTALDAGQPESAPLTLSDGTGVPTQMMHQTGSYAYYRGAGFQAVRLPYGQGRLCMLIVLPDAGVSLGHFVAGITPARLKQWTAQMQKSQGSITLPRFTSTFANSLQLPLTSLGMGTAPSDTADFHELAPRPRVSDVEHRAVVEVNGSGTGAAVATTVTVIESVALPAGFVMTMNYPFFYAIEDGKTGEPLFVGILVNPS